MKNPTATLLISLLLVGCAKDPMAAPQPDPLADEKKKSEIIEDRPLTADSHFAAGQLAAIQGDFPRAIQQYQIALKIDPKHTAALFHLAMVYTAQQQFPQAIDTWNKYIRATNNSAAGYSNLGFCYELAKQPRDAEAAYQSGIAKDPKNQPCRVNYGLMLARQGNFDQAAAHLQVVLSPAEVHYDLASVLESQGQKDRAKSEYRKALELDPTMGDAKSRLAALGNE